MNRTNINISFALLINENKLMMVELPIKLNILTSILARAQRVLSYLYLIGEITNQYTEENGRNSTSREIVRRACLSSNSCFLRTDTKGLAVLVRLTNDFLSITANASLVCP